MRPLPRLGRCSLCFFRDLLIEQSAGMPHGWVATGLFFLSCVLTTFTIITITTAHDLRKILPTDLVTWHAKAHPHPDLHPQHSSDRRTLGRGSDQTRMPLGQQAKSCAGLGKFVVKIWSEGRLGAHVKMLPLSQRGHTIEKKTNCQSRGNQIKVRECESGIVAMRARHESNLTWPFTKWGFPLLL